MRPSIFITFGEPLVARNIFGTKFWPSFVGRWGKDVSIVVLTLPEKLEYCQKTFAAPGVVFEPVEPRFRGRFASLVTSLARSAIKNHTNLWSKMRSYERGDSSFVVTIFKRVHTFLLGGQNWYKHLLRRLILKIEPAPGLAALYERYKPRLLVETSITNFDFDVPVAAEAHRRGVRILGITRGWDNFSSHGLLRVVPDKILIQNRFLREMALKFQAIDTAETEMEIIGIPHYDWYKEIEKFLMPREEFLQSIGLDPSKKFLLYGAMGDFLFPREGEVADVLESLIEGGKVNESAQVLFRAHPKFKSPLEHIGGMKHVKPDLGVTTGEGAFSGVALGARDNAHMLNSVYHCDVLVTSASTMAIDGAALDKPVVCVAFDGLAKEGEVSYWHSVKRFYDCYTHFEEFLKVDGARVAYTPEALATEINAYLANPFRDREGRRKIVERFVEPFDGKATERLECAISVETEAALNK